MKKMNSLAILTLGFSVMLTACGGSNGNSASSGTASPAAASSSSSGEALPVIKLATQTALSGANAEMGIDVKNGVELAVEENVERFKSLGFDLQLLSLDDKSDAMTGTTNAKSLVNDKDVLVELGNIYSSVLFAAMPIYEEANLPVISAATTNPGLSREGWKTFHRVSGTDDTQGPDAAQFIFDEGIKDIFIVASSDDYGRGLADEFRKKADELGMDVLGNEQVDPQETDFNTISTRIVASGAKAVFFGGFYAQGGQFLKQLSDKKYSGMFVSGDGINDNGFLETARAENVGNVYFASVVGDLLNDPEGQVWAAKYRAAFGKDPGAFGVYAYDSALIALSSIEKAISDNGGGKPTREQVNDIISLTSGFEGILSKVTFDEKGDNVDATNFIKTFKSGTYPAEQIKAME